jgi:hypothetical protein
MASYISKTANNTTGKNGSRNITQFSAIILREARIYLCDGMAKKARAIKRSSRRCKRCFAADANPETGQSLVSG